MDDDALQAARERALANLDVQVQKILTARMPLPARLPDDQIGEFVRRYTDEQMVPALRRLKAERERVLSPSWHPLPPRRPRRQMPSLWAIASYWHVREGNPLLLDAEAVEFPYCFACSAMAPGIDEDRPVRIRWNAAGRWLDRAHLVDRVFAGLDGPQNIVPLCYPCHKVMPSFRVEQGAEAIRWVIDGGRFATVRAVAAEVAVGA
jgi:hypothetical protein